MKRAYNFSDVLLSYLRPLAYTYSIYHSNDLTNITSIIIKMGNAII
jgi:hypothetical protein